LDTDRERSIHEEEISGAQESQRRKEGNHCDCENVDHTCAQNIARQRAVSSQGSIDSRTKRR